jgi:two-component system, LuxR family, sensor kinase FixL
MLRYLSKGSRTAVLVRATLLIGGIALVDWKVETNISFGFLYLFPMLMVGAVLARWQIAFVSGLCTLLAESFDPFPFATGEGIPRVILMFAAFFGAGLFVLQSTKNRQQSEEHMHEIEKEMDLRRDAEEQLKVLVESSPVAILTINAEGSVLLANDASHRLLALPPRTLPGKSIREYLPSLVTVPAHGENRQSFRTVMQCRGRRADGEVFLADVWFSTYRTSAGSRLAAIVLDTSEDLRLREEFSLHQLQAGSRILVGAVSHEIRNVCGAIAVVHQNLARDGALAQNKDFEALGTLIRALEKIAAMELRQTANQATSVDLYSLIEELRIIVDHSLRDEGITMVWNIEPELPPVWADRQSLMQVFLNLTKNSERAMLNQSRRELIVSARAEKQRVAVQFRDTGCGVSDPDRLFRPFQPGAQATGLGLYLSRAFLRSFRGELHYEKETDGSSFVVELSPAVSIGREDKNGPGNPDSIGGRPHAVSRESQPATPGRA